MAKPGAEQGPGLIQPLYSQMRAEDSPLGLSKVQFMTRRVVERIGKEGTQWEGCSETESQGEGGR